MIRQTLITDFYKKSFFGWNFFKLIKLPLNYVMKNNITTTTTNSHSSISQKQTLITDYYSTIINQFANRDLQQKITSYFSQQRYSFQRSKL
jgi:hypothetical protein